MYTALPGSMAMQYEFIALTDKVGIELCPWLEKHLLRFAGGNWWKKNVRGVLNPEEQQKIDDGSIKKLQDMDLHMLLKVLERNYNFLKARLSLPAEGRDLIYDFRQIRNRSIAHRPVRGSDLEQLIVDIHSLELFCSAIMNSKGLCSEFHTLIEHAERVQTVTRCDVKPGNCYENQPKAYSPEEVSLVPVVNGLSVPDMFEGHELTGSQKIAAANVEKFLQDKKARCLVLKGYAGTGKTFLIGGIVRSLEARHIATVLMAPTGRAAHVMKEMHHIPASTIHRQIYSLNQLKEFKEVGNDGSITYKFYYDLCNNDSEHDTVFIVDEASMVSDVYSEAEFMHFGSGLLLRDLLEYINFDGNDYRKKIIFVGDDAQLPPVKMNKSPALDVNTLEKYIREKVQSIEMTDIVRQKEGGLVLENATSFRKLLATRRYTTFDFKSDQKTVSEVLPKNFIGNYLDHIDHTGTAESVIVSHSNSQAKDYNTAVRQHLFPSGRILEPNDKVMIVRNNYRYAIDLFNGQVGTVEKVGDSLEKHEAFVNVGLGDDGKRKSVLVELFFRTATITFDDLEGQQHDLSCLYIENLLESRLPELSSEESKALYVDFCNRNRDLPHNRQEFKQALISDPYFNAVQIKHAYAVTCHKAQGGEWPTVYIDFSGQNKLDEMAIRWSYTALTRASQTVVATNALHHSLLTPARPRIIASSVAIVQPNSTETTNATQKVDNEVALPMFLSSAGEIEKQIYIRLRNLLPETSRIEGLVSNPYQSLWDVSYEGRTGILKVYYNGRNCITRVFLETPSGGNWDASFLELMQKLNGAKLVAGGPGQASGTPKIHIDFHEAIKTKCNSLNISIRNVEDLSQFHSRYTYDVAGDTLSVNYYFNAKEMFTSMMPEGLLTEAQQKTLDNIHSKLPEES